MSNFSLDWTRKIGSPNRKIVMAALRLISDDKLDWSYDQKRTLRGANQSQCVGLVPSVAVV